MIDYKQSLRANYVRHCQQINLTHPEKVLFTTVFLSRGIIGEVIHVAEVKRAWPKTLYGVVYHTKYLMECADMGWINRPHPGYATITDEGLLHIQQLLTPQSDTAPLADTTELLVFSVKQAHDFDSLLRKALSSATSHVLIADSYVDAGIFDTLLENIPSDVKIDLMYNNDGGDTFHQRARRFKIQYPTFQYGRYPKLHDRYLVIDGIGFVIGPSLKDATVNAPAIIVRIDAKQSRKLTTLFTNIYANIKKS